MGRNNMTIEELREAGRKGAEVTKQILIERLKKNEEEYNLHPKLCPICGKPIPFDKRKNIACSQTCGTKVGNKKHSKESYIKQAETLRKTLLAKGYIEKSKNERCVISPKSKHYNKIVYCKQCGAEKGQCKDHFVCSKYQLYPGLVKFGFDITSVGTERVIDEFYRIRNLLEHEYRDNRITEEQLKEKYGYTSGIANFHKILKSMKIETMSTSEAIPLSYKLGRYNVCKENQKYLESDHISWEGKHFHLRSSYESDYANELDKNHIKYNYECFSIVYYDTQKQKYRTSIPDFYLSDTNTIVEIKSDWTLDKQNMIDKMNRYVELGYNFKLILNHKETNIFEYNDIKHK